MAKIFITRKIPHIAEELLTAKGHTVHVSDVDGVLPKDILISKLQEGAYDAVLSLLTDKIDADVMEAAGAQCKIFANYAVGYDNIDMHAAKKFGKYVSNTPGVLTDAVAEHAVALLLSSMRRIPEADVFTRQGKYTAWAPELLLGNAIAGKTLAVVGLGRIGSRVAEIMHKGFQMQIAYYDVQQNPAFESAVSATFYASLESLLLIADAISVHVPLLPTTKHLFSDKEFSLMKPGAYIVNTSRGPVIDEQALVRVLTARTIRGAALDVFEAEPALTPGLAELSNVVLTPHIASATEEARGAMARMAAENILLVLEGSPPREQVPYPENP